MSITIRKLSAKAFIFTKTNYNKPINFERVRRVYKILKSGKLSEKQYFTREINSLVKKTKIENTSKENVAYILDIKKDMDNFQFYRKTSGNGNLKQIARFKIGNNNILYAYLKMIYMKLKLKQRKMSILTMN